MRSASVSVACLLVSACLSDGERPPIEHAIVDSVLIGSRPYGVAISAGGTALVTQLDAGRVQRIHLNPRGTPTPITVGAVPTGIAASPSANVALVTNQHSFNMGFVDVTAGTQTKTIGTRSNTFRVAFRSDGTRAYVTQSEGPFLVIDVTQRIAIDSVTTVGVANGIAIVGDTLAILTSTSGVIAYIDLRDHAEIRRLVGGTGFRVYQDIVVAKDGSEFYVASENAAGIEVRSVATGSVITTIPVARGTFGLALTPDGRRLWATHVGFDAGLISVIDPAKREVLRTIPARDPRRIAFDRNGAFGVVSSQAGWVYFLR